MYSHKVLFTSDIESNKACCVPNAWDQIWPYWRGCISWIY